MAPQRELIAGGVARAACGPEARAPRGFPFRSPRPRLSRAADACLLAALLGVLLAGCAPRDGADAALDSGRRAEAGASPREAGSDAPAAPQLTDSHPGWRQQLCFDCHGVTTRYPHTAELRRPPDCRACHGPNGAPQPEHAVREGGRCGACHATVRHFAAFDSPDDCIACHHP